MAGKRTATSDLNHENWDREDEPEDAGTFQRASHDSLKRRIIKTARRRNPISSVRVCIPFFNYHINLLHEKVVSYIPKYC